MTGDLANLVANNIDVGAMAATLDPSKANDDQYRRIYGHMSAGPYVITLPEGVNMRIDGMSIDDAGLNPSRGQLPKLMTMIPLAEALPSTPAQEREVMEEVASFYGSIRIGNFELRGFSLETPQGPQKLQAIRFNLANGKIGEMAFEGFDGRAPNGPIKLGRFALKSFDVANFMRVAAQLSGVKPSTEQMLALLPLIEGIEIKALSAPSKTTGQPVDIDTLSLDWGQFIGPIPSKLRMISKMSTPLDLTELNQQKLSAAGLTRVTIDTDLGAAWTEASRSFALEPVKFELVDLLNATARLSLANVHRESSPQMRRRR